MRNLPTRQLSSYINVFSLCFFLSILILSICVTFAAATTNSTANATRTAMDKAMNVLNTAANATANATQAGIEQAKNIMASVTNNVSNTASNITGAAMNEANKLISEASNASANATNATGTLMTQPEPVVPTAPNETSNATGTSMTNYSSNHYQIHFQYPTNWDLTEKTSRFDEGTDISVSGFSPSGVIAIQYLNTSLIQDMDLQSAVYEFFKTSINSDYKKEYKVIEQPSFVNIDNQKAGSFLFTQKDKYEEFATKWATQVWVVYVGNHGYLLSFMASTNVFDAPEIKNIRDQFIGSIKFMGMGKATNHSNTNVPNRFG